MHCPAPNARGPQLSLPSATARGPSALRLNACKTLLRSVNGGSPRKAQRFRAQSPYGLRDKQCYRNGQPSESCAPSATISVECSIASLVRLGVNSTASSTPESARLGFIGDVSARLTIGYYMPSDAHDVRRQFRKALLYSADHLKCWYVNTSGI